MPFNLYPATVVANAFFKHLTHSPRHAADSWHIERGRFLQFFNQFLQAETGKTASVDALNAVYEISECPSCSACRFVPGGLLFSLLSFRDPQKRVGRLFSFRNRTWKHVAIQNDSRVPQCQVGIERHNEVFFSIGRCVILTLAIVPLTVGHFESQSCDLHLGM